MEPRIPPTGWQDEQKRTSQQARTALSDVGRGLVLTRHTERCNESVSVCESEHATSDDSDTTVRDTNVLEFDRRYQYPRDGNLCSS
jgi:hypothetical protein